MVKFGKLYRDLQTKEFKGNYIDYKKLKQKIKRMEKILPRTSQEIITKQRNSNHSSIKMNFRSSLSDDGYSRNESIYFDKYGAELKEFKELLDKEFQKCYKFFKKIRKQLYTKINKHLYLQTSYSSYKIEDIIKELGNLRLTLYLAKCLNAFINDNMMAIKKILKKFDKKFYNYFGNFGPKYILDNLCMQNSDLEYLLQFKVIDETSCIIESNVKSLRDSFLEMNDNSQNSKTNKNNFYQKYNEILGYIKDIAELMYFKIQYKEWFYFSKKDKIVSTQSKLYKNIMFNPILFSAYYKDDLMHKFLSRKEEIKEVNEIQIPLSLKNKINILLIFIQTFFYNSLISGIYPLIFLLIRELNIDYIKYTFLIIASTYFCSYFSIMFYHYFGANRIKIAYVFSYILFFIGSLLYIFSYQDNYNESNSKKKSLTIGLLIVSRILIGLGANPTMGKNYILSYASQYFLPSISKYYVLVSILGHSFGPFIGFILYSNDENKSDEIFPKFYYSDYNCTGWYGALFSLFFGILHLIFFTPPNSKGFRKLKIKNSFTKKENNDRETNFLSEDIEDTEDKEFYKLQKEMKNKENLDIIEEIEEDNNSVNSSKLNSKYSNKKTTQEKTSNLLDVDLDIKKTSTLEDINSITKNEVETKYDVNPLLMFSENKEKNKDENDYEHSEDIGKFENINMVPRTIEDLIRKEKTTFSYLNRNLLMILTILFFSNLLKENFIAYCSYYIYISKNQDSKFSILFKPKYFCGLISISYLLEIISIFFILPLYKINRIIKKSLVILLVSTIILMIPLSFNIDLFVYFIIISFIILISSIIETLSSCYLAYLTPPDWKLSQINAGALPLYIITFGKLCGCIICLSSFTNIILFNNHVVIFLTFIGYLISGYYIIKSKNFRIKAIARIMRKSELETNVY